jgi:hypothetical protein
VVATGVLVRAGDAAGTPATGTPADATAAGSGEMAVDRCPAATAAGAAAAAGTELLAGPAVAAGTPAATEPACAAPPINGEDAWRGPAFAASALAYWAAPLLMSWTNCW